MAKHLGTKVSRADFFVESQTVVHNHETITAAKTVQREADGHTVTTQTLIKEPTNHHGFKETLTLTDDGHGHRSVELMESGHDEGRGTVSATVHHDLAAGEQPDTAKLHAVLHGEHEKGYTSSVSQTQTLNHAHGTETVSQTWTADGEGHRHLSASVTQTQEAHGHGMTQEATHTLSNDGHGHMKETFSRVSFSEMQGLAQHSSHATGGLTKAAGHVETMTREGSHLTPMPFVEDHHAPGHRTSAGPGAMAGLSQAAAGGNLHPQTHVGVNENGRVTVDTLQKADGLHVGTAVGGGHGRLGHSMSLSEAAHEGATALQQMGRSIEDKVGEAYHSGIKAMREVLGENNAHVSDHEVLARGEAAQQHLNGQLAPHGLHVDTNEAMHLVAQVAQHPGHEPVVAVNTEAGAATVMDKSEHQGSGLALEGKELLAAAGMERANESEHAEQHAQQQEAAQAEMAMA